MLNKEKYSEQLVEIALRNSAVAVVKGKLVVCDEIHCEECDFYLMHDCASNAVKWANSEYVEPRLKLTRKENWFCQLIKTGYLVRQKDGSLYWTNREVTKHKNERWESLDPYYNDWIYMGKFFSDLDFEFIEWEDEEPWAVEDLLKLEVEE